MNVTVAAVNIDNDEINDVENDSTKMLRLLLKMRPKVKSDYRRKKNCIVMVFEKFPEILIKGHSAFVTTGLDKMKARAEFSNDIFSAHKVQLQESR